MRDKQDALALSGEVFHYLHELLYLLRGEHRRGLVENEDLVFAVEHFEDLGALLHTDGDVLDKRVGLDAQAVPVAQLKNFLSRSVLVEEAQLFRRLVAEDDVVEHREALDELEVLVNHADPEAVCVVGVFYLDLLAVLLDNALFCLIQAEQYAHQGALTRAVLAEQRVYLAPFELDGDIIVGDYTRKSLGYMQHLYRICLFQNPNLPFRV